MGSRLDLNSIQLLLSPAKAGLEFKEVVIPGLRSLRSLTRG
jgi:hypothetical protein